MISDLCEHEQVVYEKIALLRIIALQSLHHVGGKEGRDVRIVAPLEKIVHAALEITAQDQILFH